MKRIRVQRWSGQLLSAPSAPASCVCLASQRLQASIRRHQSTTATSTPTLHDGAHDSHALSGLPDSSITQSAYPSPLPEKALSSAKLAALHARLALSQKIPLQTLARTLVDTSADQSPQFNNSNLALLGNNLINYHVTEWLMCRYPRLPLTINYTALKAYAGPQALYQIARQWGVDSAAAPGDEVDPGLLQYSITKERPVLRNWGYERPESLYQFKWRRGIGSRVVMDDDFGDMITEPKNNAEHAENQPSYSLSPLDSATKRDIAANVHADFVRAVVGAIYAHCGRDAVKAFVKAHVLSRQLNFASLFTFRLPTRELAMLCAREGFEKPVARLLSETGRHSRTPVFVVGIYSGNDKLGEGAAASLDAARAKAAMNALKSWYLYSPGENVRVPSDVLTEGAKPWEPVYIDIGEIL
ncbi:uncharacterized protein E0L32_008563 [Thyridium curvatum]|uniref:Large ribosomal subunit protein mL44 n=1 Tax=Thyridium curvatum TaxID=1093900 RepID=A0A507ARS7_9PEZI|nr:uncharacterized protein E0L32_008563 [Thyridium curvatum]TPX10513.1 hypothetical protein E0L32_008563 [Thyridium curvatum]